MNSYHDKVYFAHCCKTLLFDLKELFFVILIKTSKNKNHFILKKSQRTVEVVLTLFILLILTWQEIKTKSKKQTNNFVRTLIKHLASLIY